MRTNEELRHALFEALLVQFDQQRRSAALRLIHNSVHTFCFERNGNHFEYDDGDGEIIGNVRMVWKPGPDNDKPSVFRIRRSRDDSSKLQMSGGPEITVDVAAKDLVKTFLGHSQT